MKRNVIVSFALLIALIVSLLTVHAEDQVIINNWNEPTPEQIEEAVRNRMPLPEEYSGRSFGIRSASDATTRIYTNVQFTYCEINDKYNPIGYATYRNRSGSNVTLPYSQNRTKTTAWNVTANISGNASIIASAIAKIQAAVGVPVGISATMSQSSAENATMTVPSGKTGTIYAYHSAVEVQGTISWADMDGGVIVGGGIENVGGAFIISGIYFENEES